MGIRERLERDLADKKVLVVGAGGIGCELLKDLVLTGVKNIHTIDLDTIDVSNLNRQFLFRREHVSKAKAEVAAASVKNLQPDVNITYDHDSIFNGEKYGVQFFKGFDAVVNALDNRAARSHVNRLCLSADVPLIESGSAGYLGQTAVILKGQTECYECVQKPVQKTFPGCTIRNTPSEHIHCTVWSKHCFNQLFGEMDIDDDVSPDFQDPENQTNGTEAGKENHANGANGTSNNDSEARPELPNTRQWAEMHDYDAKMIFNKLFHDDISYLLLMKDLWKTRRAPKPLDWSNATSGDFGGGSTEMTDELTNVTKQWTMSACANVFNEAVSRLKDRMRLLPEGELLVWDKDDTDAMHFVAAAANIRAHIFGIPGKSLFDIKSDAGNIIPAIATTNAIVAGMAIGELLKVLYKKQDRVKNVFVRKEVGARGHILATDGPYPPKKGCFVCSTDKREVFVRVNTKIMTLRLFVDKVLKAGFSVQQPEVMVDSSIVFSADEDDDNSGMEAKLLHDIGFFDGKVVVVDDFSQDLNFNVIIINDDTLKADEHKVDQDSGAKPNETAAEEETDRKRKLVDEDQLNDFNDQAKKIRVEE
ncbi:unnamed protein product, partial [Mesorhabditis spiculigera]